MGYKVKIEPEAYQDIQKGVDWYENELKGLGGKFHSEIKAAFRTIELNPFYQVRYSDIRCYPLKKYPFMIHFSVNEKNNQVIVRAIFHSSRDPGNWLSRIRSK